MIPRNDYWMPLVINYMSLCDFIVLSPLPSPHTEDTLLSDAGECSICLDDMMAGEFVIFHFQWSLFSYYKGDEIARLPCLCIYHVK